MAAQTQVRMLESVSSLGEGGSPPFSFGVGQTVLIDVSLAIAWAAAGRCQLLGGWQKVTVPFTSLTAAALVQAINLFALPANSKLMGITVKHSVQFTGPGLSWLSIELGGAGFDLPRGATYDQGSFLSGLPALPNISLPLGGLDLSGVRRGSDDSQGFFFCGIKPSVVIR